VTTIEYRRRIVDDELDELFDGLAAISIEGAKAVGKTATALQRARTVYALDDPDQRSLAEADINRLLEGENPVLIDEWQYVPTSWDRVRRAVDSAPVPGSYLLTGSASPPPDARTHSGAGRIVTVRMRTLTLPERGLEQPSVSLEKLLSGDRAALRGETDVRLSDYAEEILASGFPGLRGLEGRALRVQLDGYIARITERDFPEQGHIVRNPAALRRWLTAYAAASSTTASFETIRSAAMGGHRGMPSRVAVGPYRDILERLWILDPVPAWLPTRSHLRRLASPPKHQLVDPALAARLVGVELGALLRGDEIKPAIARDGTFLGALFESLVTLDVRVFAQSQEASVGHLRTYGGEHEVDLVVQRSDGRVVAIEVKLSETVGDGDVRHLKWLRERLGDDLLDTIVVTTGSYAFRRSDGIGVVPAALLGP
jgi:hypothetical protein